MNYNRKILAAVLLTMLAFVPACRRKRGSTAEGAPELASTVHLGDPRVADQLVAGFHQIEANAWRWTARKFTVVLRAPAGSGQVGAVLQVHLTVPPVVIDKVGSITLSGSAGGAALSPETYSKPGDYIYQRDVPADAIRSSAIRVEFQLDKSLEAGSVDQRELGIVVSSIGLSLK